VPGIVYKRGNEIVENPPGKIIEVLDQLPFPYRGSLNKLIHRFGNENTAATLSTSRGCFGNCAFCSISQFYKTQGGPRHRIRTVENFVKEIKFLINEYSVNHFVFEDANWYTVGAKGKAWFEEFYQAIIREKLDIHFDISIRVYCLDEDVISKMDRIGLERVYLGIESFNEERMVLVNKGINVSQNCEVLDILQSYGFRSDYNTRKRIKMGFIMFFPDTTPEEILDQLIFIKKYKVPAKKLLVRLLPQPGTDIAKKFQLKSDVYFEDYKEYFQYEPVQLIYEAYKEYIHYISLVKEVIRTIQKSNIDQEGHRIELLEFLYFAENSAYDLLEELASICLSSKSQELKTLMREILVSHVEHFDNYIIENSIVNKLQHILSEVNTTRIKSVFETNHDLHQFLGIYIYNRDPECPFSLQTYSEKYKDFLYNRNNRTKIFYMEEN
jgi:radical SAM superfamily enzyme YgiQ (UPF0313 family)